MSSMGDVIHCLPAVTDLLRHQSGIDLDWVVEENFVDLVNLHQGVTAIPVAIRRWRKNWIANWSEFAAFRTKLQSKNYDVIVDAQGLVKSAVVASMARGPVVGFDGNSARESIAALTYSTGYSVLKSLHAIERQRRLFAAHFGYELTNQIDYSLDSKRDGDQKQTIMFLHGTTWSTKHWPDQCWLKLAKLFSEAGYQIKLPWVSEAEKSRADQIADEVELAIVLPRLELSDLANELQGSAGVVSVDTGLGHLAAALNVPLVGLYGPTDPALTGMYGSRQISLIDSDLDCAPCLNGKCRYKADTQSSKIHPPCFDKLTPERVFEELSVKIEQSLNPKI